MGFSLGLDTIRWGWQVALSWRVLEPAEERPNQSDPRAMLVALGRRVDKATRYHQGPLYAQGGIRCHTEKKK